MTTQSRSTRPVLIVVTSSLTITSTLKRARKIARSKWMIRLTFAYLLAVAEGTFANPSVQAGFVSGITLSGKETFSATIVGASDDPNDHAANYNGQSTVTAQYSITFTTDSKGNVVVDSSKSYVTLITQTYKDKNKNQIPTFKSLAIPIINVTQDSKHNLNSYSFSGPWYPNPQDDGITDKGSSGTININGKKSTLDSTYKYEDPHPYHFTYRVTSGTVPEPSSLMLVGLGTLSLLGYWLWVRGLVGVSSLGPGKVGRTGPRLAATRHALHSGRPGSPSPANPSPAGPGNGDAASLTMTTKAPSPGMKN